MLRNDISRRTHLMMYGACLLPMIPFLATGPASAAPPHPFPVLATPEQLAAETLLLRLLEEPEVKAAMSRAEAELSRDPIAQTIDGKARLPNFIRQITTNLMLNEYVGDVHHPGFIWASDDTPHFWFGREVPGSAMANDNPDQIYRQSYIDGRFHYRVSGKLNIARRPAQLSFSIIKGWQAGVPFPQEKGKVFLGNQYATRSLEDLKVGADGSFEFTLGPDRNPRDATHVTLEPGPFIVLVRDVLSDWQHQMPPRLSIRRTDRVTAPPRSDAEIRSSILTHLHDYAVFWGTYSHRFVGGLAANAIAGPFAREGGIGYFALARFHLEPGQVAVITIGRGGAAYSGVLGMDPWMVTFDGRTSLASLNNTQSIPNPDGSFTYVASPTDPGVANWIDTSGLHDGFLCARWLGFPKGHGPDGLLKNFSIVSLADLTAGALAQIPRTTPAARRAQLEQRGKDYHRRLEQ